MAQPPRILIVTAAFGEGHNSAARNLALALDAVGATTQVSDPCLLGTPAADRHGDRRLPLRTTDFPKIWAKIYDSTDQCDLSRQALPLMGRPDGAGGT